MSPESDDSPPIALRNAIPTTKRASALFDMVAARLGERAVVHTAGPDNVSRVMHVRAGGDGALIMPWSLLQFSVADPAALEDSPADDDNTIVPWPTSGFLELALHAIPASLALHDGSEELRVHYRRDGRWKDCAQGFDSSRFRPMVEALKRGTAGPLELLSEYVASIDLGRHGPGRVLLPRLQWGGPEGVWNLGRNAIRAAVASGRAPAGASWAVADGYEARVVVFGATREAAMAAWRAEVERVRPKPPKTPEAPPLPSPDAGTFEPTQWHPEEGAGFRAEVFLSGGGWHVPPFDPSPAATPAAVLPIAAMPAHAAAKGLNTRWIGERGTTHFAARLPRDDGFTLVGEALLGRFDLATIDAALDRLAGDIPDTNGAARFLARTGIELTHRTVYYRCVDPHTGAPIEPRVDQAPMTVGFDARGFDGDLLRSTIVRVSRIA